LIGLKYLKLAPEGEFFKPFNSIRLCID